MEVQLRNLLQNVLGGNQEDGKNRVQSCFDIIERLSNKEIANSPNALSSDIYILCCEAALSVKRNDLAANCLQLFFSRTIQMNQFVCRAYICQAQLIAPTDSSNPVKFEEAAAYLLKATSIAKTNPKYYFIIFNVSLCYWTLARPLMRPGYRRFLSRSLNEISRSLEMIDDKDYDWRCQLLLLLAESHLDGGRRSEATAACLSCLQLARLHVPKRLFDLLRFVIRHSLMDHQKFAREMKTSSSLAIVYGICRIKYHHDSPPEKSEKQPAPHGKGQTKGSVDSLSQSQSHESSVHESATSSSTTTVSSSQTESIASEAYSPNEEIAKLAAALLENKSYSPPAFPVSHDLQHMQRDQKKASPMQREHSRTKDSSPKRKEPLIEMDTHEHERVALLLEFCRICLDYGYMEYAKETINCTKQTGISSADMSVKMSFIESEFKVKSLGEKQFTYSKTAVNTRSEAIRQCTETLAASQRSSGVEAGTIEMGACILWNLCLPLCQPPFYSIVRRPLSAAMEALAAIGSLELRAMAQMESMLSKCEEDVEQNVTALERLEHALEMDEAAGGLHAAWLQASINRLRLKTELYKQPDRIEDQATMILEQCKSVSDSALSFSDRRTLLIQVGNILAPEDFVTIVGVEAEAMASKDGGGSGGTASPIRVRGSAARSYKGSLMKLRAYGGKQTDPNFAEKLRLWIDLCKASRKHEVWDVCRAAARFALIYDDDRISISPQKKGKAKHQPPTKHALAATSEESLAHGSDSGSMGDENLEDHPAFPSKEEITAFSNRELLRMVGEVRQILGEALIQLSKCHKCELYEPPILTEEMARKHIKFYPDSMPFHDEDWIEYKEWLQSISDEAVACFLRSGEHAKNLGEPLLAVNAAVCFWNYATHLVASNFHRQIVNKLETALGYIRVLGHERSTGLVVDLCLAIATAYIQPWVPPPKPPLVFETEGGQPAGEQGEQPAGGGGGSKSRKELESKNSTAKPTPGGKATDGVSSPEAIADLKKALEVLEYGLSLTDGHIPANIVPIGTRLPLIRTWLSVKQMLQQSLPKNLLPDRELPESHQCHHHHMQSRAICAVEILRIFTLQSQPTAFKDATTLQKALILVDKCEWVDPIVRLEAYCQLARFCTMPSIAGTGPTPTADYTTAVRCAQLALGTPPVKTPPKSPLAISEANLRCQAALFLGESLIRSQGMQMSVRLQACKSFSNAAKFASIASDPYSALSAMRQFWNTALLLFRTSSGRKSIRPLVYDLLANVKAACKQFDQLHDKAYAKAEQENANPSRKRKVTIKIQKRAAEDDDADEDDENVVPGVAPSTAESTRDLTPSVDGPDDLTIRVSLYALLFQSYLDEGKYEDCLKVLDKALAELPRTKHRLLLFKHRIMTKARLGVSVKMIEMDIHRFKMAFLTNPDEAESEEQVAEMWKKVALSSINATDQFQCYQNAIETLRSSIHNWTKAELYLEVAQLLHFHDRPVDTIILHLRAVVDLIMRTVVEVKPAAGSLRASQGKGKARTKRQKEKVVDTEQVVPKKPPEELQLSDISSVRQLEVLLRTHTVMAVVGQRGSVPRADQIKHCATAYAIICRLIKVLIESSAQIAKDIAKARAVEDKEKGAKSPKTAKGRDGNDLAAALEKPKRKIPVDFFPTTLDDWSMFEMPDEIIDTFRSDKVSQESVVSSKSIPQAALTFRWLEELENQMKIMELHHLLFPVLCLQNILARSIYADKSLLALIHMKYEMLNYQLNLLSAASFHEKLRCYYGDILILLSDQAKWRLKIVEETENAANMVEDSNALEATAALRERAALARKNLFLQKIDSQPSSLKIMVDAAEILLKREDYQAARQFLWEVGVIMNGTRETSGSEELLPRCIYLKAVLAYRECRYEDVITTLKALESNDISIDGELLAQSIVLHSRAITDDPVEKEGLEKARQFLVNSWPLMLKANKYCQNQSKWLEALEAFVEMRQAEVDYGLAKQNYYRLQQFQAEQISLIIDRFLKCAEILKNAGYRLECIEAMQLRMTALLWQADVFTGHRNNSFTISNANKSMRLKTLCKTLESANSLVMWADEWFAESMNVLPEAGMSYLQPQSVSLFAQRLLVHARIVACETVVQLFRFRVEEMRRVRNEEERKTAVLRVVEAFTEAQRQVTSDEKVWEDMTRSFPDSIFAWLKVAFNNCSNTLKMKAEVLSLLGRVSHLSGLLASPDPPIHWEIVQRGIASDIVAAGVGLKPSTAPEDSRPVSENSGRVITPTAASEQQYMPPQQTLEDIQEMDVVDADGEQRKLTANDIHNMKELLKDNVRGMDRAKRFLAQACDFLQQAVNLSLKIGNRETCSTAALQLVEIFGQLEPSLTAYYLMVYQNCRASLYLEDLVVLSQPDTNASLQASLFNLLKNFQKYNLITNLMVSPLYRNVIRLLEMKSMAWRRLVLSQNPFDIMKDFPPIFTFLILQHSSDNRCLYAAIPERQAGKPVKEVKDAKKNAPPAAQAAAAQAAAAAMQATCARVAKLDLGSSNVFEGLLSNWQAADQHVGQISLKHRYQADVVLKRQKMSATGNEGEVASAPPTQSTTTNKPTEETDLGDIIAEDADAAEREEELRGLDDEFHEQLTLLNEYLEPLIKQLLPSLRPLRNISAAVDGKGKGNKSPTVSNQQPQLPLSAIPPTVETWAPETLIVLADPALLELPLEAVDLIRSSSFAAVGRDFSMELLWHRIKDDVTMEPQTSEDDAKKTKQQKLPSRVPALRESGANKKQAGGGGGGKGGSNVVVARQLPAVGCLPVDTHAFRYFLDVGQDYWPEEETAPIAVYQNIAEKFSSSFMQKWLGVTGYDHTPSPGEWEAYIRDGASGFMYYGTEYLASSLAPDKLGILCAPALWLMLSFDLTQTPTSYSRQSKLDLDKTSTTLALEKPVCIAGLMALAGIRCAVAARSMRPVTQQAQSSNNILNLLLGNGITTGQVIRVLNLMSQEGIEFIVNPPPPPKAVDEGSKQKDVPAAPAARGEQRLSESQRLEGATPNSAAFERAMTAIRKPSRDQFTMVCYGLPNLVITQLPPANPAAH